MIRPGTVTRGGVRTGAGGQTSLTREDAVAITDLRDVVAVAPSVRSSAQIRYRGTNRGTSVEGVTPPYVDVKQLAAGRRHLLPNSMCAGAARLRARADGRKGTVRPGQPAR